MCTKDSLWRKTVGVGRLLSLGVGLSLCHEAVSGALIQPDTVTVSSVAGPAYVGANTINDSGLPLGFGPGNSHAPYFNNSGGNHWTSDGVAPTDEWIRWGFTSAQDLGAIYLWNHQSSAGLAANSGYDVTLFDLTLLDSGNNIIQFYDNLALAPDTATGQTFSFGGLISGVSFVQFDIEAVQSSPNYTGLAEVAFDTEALSTPETGSTLLCGILGLAFLGICRRQSRAGAQAV